MAALPFASPDDHDELPHQGFVYLVTRRQRTYVYHASTGEKHAVSRDSTLMCSEGYYTLTQRGAPPVQLVDFLSISLHSAVRETDDGAKFQHFMYNGTTSCWKDASILDKFDVRAMCVRKLGCQTLALQVYIHNLPVFRSRVWFSLKQVVNICFEGSLPNNFVGRRKEAMVSELQKIGFAAAEHFRPPRRSVLTLLKAHDNEVPREPSDVSALQYWVLTTPALLYSLVGWQYHKVLLASLGFVR